MAKDEEVEWRRMRRLNGEGSRVGFDPRQFLYIEYLQNRILKIFALQIFKCFLFFFHLLLFYLVSSNLRQVSKRDSRFRISLDKLSIIVYESEKTLYFFNVGQRLLLFYSLKLYQVDIYSVSSYNKSQEVNFFYIELILFWSKTQVSHP